MIKGNELRLGNYFINGEGCYGVMPGQVDTVESIGYRGVNKWQDMGASGVCPFEKAQPIPLTHEWLLKLGFRKSIHSRDEIRVEYVHDLLGANKSFSFSGIRQIGNWLVASATPNFSVTINFSTIEYVHQLQNVTFALTGRELEMQPEPKHQ